jgi:hypothetical protein
MPVDEMKIFFHQTLVHVWYFFRATGDEKMADTMKDFWVLCRRSRVKKGNYLKAKKRKT